MKIKLSLLAILFTVTSLNAQINDFDKLLKETVTPKGEVNYSKIISNRELLDNYITYLKNTTVDSNWSENKTKAFWINAYNAYTIKLITDNYPLKSITSIKKEGKDAWNIAFANIGGKTYTLNQIEHDILRKDYSDPRIHVAVNCASFSCPPIANYAFTEENLDSKLEELMTQFVNDTNRNIITPKKAQLSKIFEWYQEDFTKEGTLINYISKYSKVEVNQKTKVQYLDYIWTLNE